MCRTTGKMSVLRNASHDAGWLREQRSSSASRLPASCLCCPLTLRMAYMTILNNRLCSPVRRSSRRHEETTPALVPIPLSTQS
jgi:hypothetical protein